METTDGRKDSGKKRGKKERTSTDGKWSKQVLVRLGFRGTEVSLVETRGLQSRAISGSIRRELASDSRRGNMGTTKGQDVIGREAPELYESHCSSCLDNAAH